jgi:hypothetical protein
MSCGVLPVGRTRRPSLPWAGNDVHIALSKIHGEVKPRRTHSEVLGSPAHVAIRCGSAGRPVSNCGRAIARGTPSPTYVRNGDAVAADEWSARFGGSRGRLERTISAAPAGAANGDASAVNGTSLRLVYSAPLGRTQVSCRQPGRGRPPGTLRPAFCARARCSKPMGMTRRQ